MSEGLPEVVDQRDTVDAQGTPGVWTLGPRHGPAFLTGVQPILRLFTGADQLLLISGDRPHEKALEALEDGGVAVARRHRKEGMADAVAAGNPRSRDRGGFVVVGRQPSGWATQPPLFRGLG